MPPREPLTGKEIEVIVLRQAAEGINDAANDLAAMSIQEAPVEEGNLRASAVYPAVAPELAARPEPDMAAYVGFTVPYAASQHEGEIVYTTAVTYTVREHERMGSTVSEHSATIGPGTVQFLNHPKGGKDHFLSDPLKVFLPRYRDYVQLKVNVGLAEARFWG